MKNGILKQTLKCFGICLPFAVSIGVWSGYGAAVAKHEAVKEDMAELRTAIYAEVKEDLSQNGQLDYVLTDEYVEEKAEQALAENEEYQKLSAEKDKWSKARMWFSAGGGFAFGLGAGAVYAITKDEDERF